MAVFLALNLASFIIGSFPIFFLGKKGFAYEPVVYTLTFFVVSVHNALPFQNPDVRRQLENTLYCLMVSFISSIMVNIPAYSIIAPLATIAFYTAITLAGFNQDLSALAIQLLIVTSTGFYFIFTAKSVLRIKDWLSVIVGMLWLFSATVYTYGPPSNFTESVNKVMYSICFSFILTRISDERGVKSFE